MDGGGGGKIRDNTCELLTNSASSINGAGMSITHLSSPNKNQHKTLNIMATHYAIITNTVYTIIC